MSAFRVVTSADHLRVRGPDRPTIGPVWLVLGGRPFPQRGWNDFVIVVLEAMGSAMIHLLDRATEVQSFAFMEGPFHVSLQRAADQVRVVAFEHSVDSRRAQIQLPRATCSVPLGTLAAEYLEAASGVLEAALKAGDQSFDCRRLAIVISRLRRGLERPSRR